MPMRQTIGISLALLVMSAGAIAKTPEKDTSHQQGQPPGTKPEKADIRTNKTHTVSHKIAHHRSPVRFASHHAEPGRDRYATSYAVAYAGAGAHDPYWGPMHTTGVREIGNAAWYGLVGGHTSSGERLDTVTATAAHRSLPLASYARVTNLDSGRSVIVKINDRGPQNRHFIIDLSPRAADEIEMRGAGVATVVVEPVVAGPTPIDAVAQTAAVFRSSGAAVTQ